MKLSPQNYLFPALLLTLCLLTTLSRAVTFENNASARSWTAGKYLLELDGAPAGWLISADGGNPVSEVAGGLPGVDSLAAKHIGGVKYEDITLTCGAGMSKAFYQWIQHSFDGKALRKSGSIIVVDYQLQVTRTVTFHDALITELGLPALDAASKDAAKMTIKFKPETISQTVNTTPVPLPANLKLDTHVQKQWLPANFRLRIDGLDEASTRVNKIEAITIKQKVADQPAGTSRGYEREPAHLEIPNLVISLPESGSKPFSDWFAQSVIQGDAKDSPWKDATLDYLASDLQQVLFRVNFHDLTITRLTPDRGETELRRVKAELYCESLSFQAVDAGQ